MPPAEWLALVGMVGVAAFGAQRWLRERRARAAREKEKRA